MKYVYVNWKSNRIDVAKDLFYEIYDDGFEKRKIEKYKNEIYSIAGEGLENEDTWISYEEFPSVFEINEDKEFEAKEISKAEFEREWDIAASKLPGR